MDLVEVERKRELVDSDFLHHRLTEFPPQQPTRHASDQHHN